MIHLGTEGQNSPEAITPGGIAAGQGDGYLIALNRAIAVWNKGIYVRPLGEMNNSKNAWSGYRANGQPKDAAHSPATYRKAFARIYVILHGGSTSAVNAKLRQLGLPPVEAASCSATPSRGSGSSGARSPADVPRVAGNAAELYYPGRGFVDVEGGSIYDERLTDTAPWQGLEKLYRFARSHKKPFSVPEWGLAQVDDPAFVQHMCTFLKTHPATEVAAFYESRPGSRYDLESKPKSRAAYRECITPLAGKLPPWAAGERAEADRSEADLEPWLRAGAARRPILARGAPQRSDRALAARLRRRLRRRRRRPAARNRRARVRAGRHLRSDVDRLRVTPVHSRLRSLPHLRRGDRGDGRLATGRLHPDAGRGRRPARGLLPDRSRLRRRGASSWQIVFGDGITRQGSGAPPRFLGHTFASAGRYNVLLIVNAPGGRQFLARTVIAVAPPGAVSGTPTGTVLLNGRPFAGGPVPFGRRVDVTNGTLRLTTNTGTLAVSGRGTVAIFVLVRGTDRGRPVVELRLAGGNFGVCRRRAPAAFAAPNPPPRVVRNLWAKGKGRYRTRGRYAAATIRGTEWLTADRCDGTLVRVTQGRVEVADLPRRRNVLVRAGRSYLARQP